MKVIKGNKCIRRQKKSVRKLTEELLPEQIAPPPESEFTLAVAGLSCLWKGVKALHVNCVITLIPAGACIPLPPLFVA